MSNGPTTRVNIELDADTAKAKAAEQALMRLTEQASKFEKQLASGDAKGAADTFEEIKASANELAKNTGQSAEAIDDLNAQLAEGAAALEKLKKESTAAGKALKTIAALETLQALQNVIGAGRSVATELGNVNKAIEEGGEGFGSYAQATEAAIAATANFAIAARQAQLALGPIGVVLVAITTALSLYAKTAEKELERTQSLYEAEAKEAEDAAERIERANRETKLKSIEESADATERALDREVAAIQRANEARETELSIIQRKARFELEQKSKEAALEVARINEDERTGAISGEEATRRRAKVEENLENERVERELERVEAEQRARVERAKGLDEEASAIEGQAVELARVAKVREDETKRAEELRKKAANKRVEAKRLDIESARDEEAALITFGKTQDNLIRASVEAAAAAETEREEARQADLEAEQIEKRAELAREAALNRQQDAERARQAAADAQADVVTGRDLARAESRAIDLGGLADQKRRALESGADISKARQQDALRKEERDVAAAQVGVDSAAGAVRSEFGGVKEVESAIKSAEGGRNLEDALKTLTDLLKNTNAESVAALKDATAALLEQKRELDRVKAQIRLGRTAADGQ